MRAVTFCGAVPTVWLNLFAWMEQNLNTTDQRGLKLKRVLSGGTAVPRVVIEKAHAYFGATMLHAWGMTEMSPLGTCGSLLARHVGPGPGAAHAGASQAGSHDLRRRGAHRR